MDVKEKKPTLEIIKSVKDKLTEDLENATDGVRDDIEDLQSAQNSIESEISGINDNITGLTNQIQQIIGGQGTVIIPEQTFGGTRSYTLYVTLQPGTYKITIDQVTSNDTDYTTSEIAFFETTTSQDYLVAIKCQRNVSISKTITLSRSVAKIVFYASEFYVPSENDIFEYTNFKMIDPSKAQDLSDYKSIAELCFNESASGTVSKTYTQNFNPGRYIISVDNITSTANDGMCYLMFADINSNGLQSLLLSREKPQLYHIKLVSQAKKLIFYAGPSYAQSLGKSYSFSNLKIWKVDEQFLNSTAINIPDGFNWEHPLEGRIHRTNNGIECVLDVAEFRPQSTEKTYWVSPSGNDSSSGTSSEPLQTIEAALNKSDARIIMLENGYYNYPEYVANSYLTHSIAFIATGTGTGKPVIGSCVYDDENFELVTDQTYTYKIQIDSNCVYDMSAYIAYKKVDSISTVEDTPGSYYVGTESDTAYTYVHTIDDSAPTTQNIKCCGNRSNFYIDTQTHTATITGGNTTYTTNKFSIYLEGIVVCGGGQGAFKVTCAHNKPGDTASYYTGQINIYAKNCEFIGGAVPMDGTTALPSGAFILKGCASVIQNCKAYESLSDGFAYHLNDGGDLGCRSVEIDCEGYNNGISSTDYTKNGSTAHNACYVIRVNGKYHHNAGPNVADTQTNAKSWNLGCSAWKSTVESSDHTASKADYIADSGAKMWLDSCIGYNSDYSLRVSGLVSSGTAIGSIGKVKNCMFNKIIYVDNLSTLEAY